MWRQGKDLKDRVAELLRVVGLLPEHMHRFPHAFQRRGGGRGSRSARSLGAPAAIHHRR